MRMLKYIAKRLLIALPVLIGITLIDFAMTCMAGSDRKSTRLNSSHAT